MIVCSKLKLGTRHTEGAGVGAVIKSHDAHEDRVEEDKTDAEARGLAEGVCKVEVKLDQNVDVAMSEGATPPFCSAWRQARQMAAHQPLP